MLFNLKLGESALAMIHINKFNLIILLVVSIYRNFGEENIGLNLLASLPNTWELEGDVVSNSVGKENMQFNDVWDNILIEEV